MDRMSVRTGSWLLWGLLAGFFWALLPSVASAQSAQSAIAGTVRDASGGILPGVTVEVSSPALIEGTRIGVTGGQGQYRIVDLRTGTYSVTFTLPGFSVLTQEGIILPADFTALVNAELSISTVQETITVTGESPLVDVQRTSTRTVLNRELLDRLPTSRHFQGIGATVPAIRSGYSDVGGSRATFQGASIAHGGTGQDMSIESDGINIGGAQVAWSADVYHNDGEFEEMVYALAGGAAEAQSSGIRINMIPREGGNQFHGEVLALWANTDLQSDNINDELIARGFKTAPALDKLWDINPSVGGPIVRDRIWFFSSYRNWRYDNLVGNVFFPDGLPAIQKSPISAYTNRITFRPASNDKLSFSWNRYLRKEFYSGIERGRLVPASAPVKDNTRPHVTQLKYTKTVGSNMLLEAGGMYRFYKWSLVPQPETVKATCFVAFDACPSGTNYGDINRVERTTGIQTVTHGAYLQQSIPKASFSAAFSYVTGSHNLKIGVSDQYAVNEGTREWNGDLQQEYIRGVPSSVNIKNSPTDSRNEIDWLLGLYVQDSWTVGRLTLNPGVRFEQYTASTGAVDPPAGRFVPQRHFDAFHDLPNWKAIVPRFGVAFDVFGDGKTAIKGSVGRYMGQTDLICCTSRYNPSVSASDRRTWDDLNGDDIAQENEIGPSQNVNFGVRRNRNPDPDLQWPYQILFNVAVDQELLAGLSVSANYYRRGFHQMIWTPNLEVLPATWGTAYTQLETPDPRDNGQTITIFSLNRPGLVDQLDTNSENNSRTYNGVEATLNARLPNGGSLMGGISSGKVRVTMCDVPDPNQLRGCDQDYPFRTIFKMSGTYALPAGFHLSGVFQSMPGVMEDRTARREGDINVAYLVTRSVLPSLGQSSARVRLNEPGSEYPGRKNQFDLSLSRTFPVGGVRLRPQLDLFNVFNASPVLDQIQTFGGALGRPLTILHPRLVRLGMRLEF